MGKSVRLSDIAAKLNVSTVTVSKALSGQKGVSDEMRAKIVSLADEMGYVKSVSTEETVKKRSYTIGVIVAERFLNENQSFYWKLYQEISKRAIARKCFPVLEVISHESEAYKEMPRIIQEEKADGIIIMGEFHKEYAQFLIRGMKCPVINLDTTCDWANCDCVVSNNLLGGYQMTNYLFESGHRKIGFVGTRLATNSIDDRYLGYLKSLMEHGVEKRDDWIIDDRDREFGLVDSNEYFRLPDEMPTAFFCNCDLSASLLIQKLKRNGYSVPEDISVVGFDNYVVDQFADIGITTYEIDTKEMAGRAVHIMIHKLENEKYTAGIFMLGGTFIERASARQIAPPVPFV
ncbi:MAG: LacI family DNA-binding transcriptional regulator [Lachnospiraceae bacterium]|nr:LacI family DNA-binding transcriptional regulator [Lachnospiraceae bacterium]